jgi:hypothetical protein
LGCGWRRRPPNILNRQSQEWSSGPWVGPGANNSSPYKIKLLRNVTGGSGLAGCCKHGDEPSGSIKGGEFLDCWLLKKDSAP